MITCREELAIHSIYPLNSQGDLILIIVPSTWGPWSTSANTCSSAPGYSTRSRDCDGRSLVHPRLSLRNFVRWRAWLSAPVISNDPVESLEYFESLNWIRTQRTVLYNTTRRTRRPTRHLIFLEIISNLRLTVPTSPLLLSWYN